MKLKMVMGNILLCIFRYFVCPHNYYKRGLDHQVDNCQACNYTLCYPLCNDFGCHQRNLDQNTVALSLGISAIYRRSRNPQHFLWYTSRRHPCSRNISAGELGICYHLRVLGHHPEVQASQLLLCPRQLLKHGQFLNLRLSKV